MKNKISREELIKINYLKQEKLFVRVAEASKIFSLSQSHLWSLLASGQLKAFKPSPKVTLLKITDLIAYVEKSIEVQ
uniref:hypothetical protein n=1 Tax=Aliarcobacter sp. TaxID=2321116 RepID=UPI0040489D25